MIIKVNKLFGRYNNEIDLDKKINIFIGETGAGKSKLLKLIMGLLEPDSGYIKLGNKTDVGYYAQELE